MEGSKENIPAGYELFTCPREIKYSTGRLEYTAYVAIDETEGSGYFWHGSI